MRVYLHWLDGGLNRALPARQESLQRSLKLHALLGDTPVLSDIQLTDSPMVGRLFADHNFRRFLADNPEFMEVVAEPGEGTGRFGITVRGLERAKDPEWVPSGDAEAGAIRELADVTFANGYVDPDLFLGPHGAILGHWPNSATALRNMHDVLAYFANGGPRVRVNPPPGNARVSYYDLLCQLEARSSLPARDRLAIDETLRWVRRNVAPENFGKRSQVVSRFPTSGGEPNEQMIRNTVIQAWNCAVETTIEPDGASATRLPHAPTIAAYLHQTTSGLMDAEDSLEQDLLDSLRHPLQYVGWDPLEINWAQLRGILDQVRDQQARYQEFQSGPDDARENALSELLHSVAPLLPKPRRQAVGKVTALLIQAGATIAGGGAGYAFGLGGTAVGIGGSFLVVPVIGGGLRRLQDARVVNTLRRDMRVFGMEAGG